MRWLLLLLMATAGIAQNRLSEKKLIDRVWEQILSGHDSAAISLDRLKTLQHKSPDALLKAKTLETEGLFYELVKSDYSKASKFYLEAVAVCQKHELSYLRNVYHSLACMFHTTDNYKKAEEYYRLALPLAEKENDTELTVKCLVNLASTASSQKQFAEAEELFKKALQYKNDFEVNRTIYANMANLFIRQQQYRKAMPYLFKGIAVNPENGNRGTPLEYAYILDAMIALKDKEGLDSALAMSKPQVRTAVNRRQKSILLKSMSEAAETLGDYKYANRLKNEYILLYDSIKSQQRDDLVYELETKYQTEKKQAEIVQTEKEKRQLTWFAGLAAAAVLVLGGLVYSNLKQKRTLANKKAQLEKLVDEKNLLLRETHHRVKNSFQIVSSLLYLQSETIQDKQAALAVKEAQNRVKSMVLIHQKLYSKDQLVGVNAKEYLEDLVRDIIDNQSAENIRVEKSIQPIVLGIDTITPIGLIANELITNILKHAFDSTIQNPTIQIELAKNDDILNFRVSDNGKGMGTPREDSFGIKLIRSLAKKLKADVNFRSDNGVSVEIKIRKFDLL